MYFKWQVLLELKPQLLAFVWEMFSLLCLKKVGSFRTLNKFPVFSVAGLFILPLLGFLAVVKKTDPKFNGKNNLLFVCKSFRVMLVG